MWVPLDKLFVLEGANPDISEADWIAMVLQTQRLLERVRCVFRWGHVVRRSQNFNVILNEHAIVKHSHGGWLGEFALFIKARCVKDDIIRLPFAGFSARIY